jgi:hypothetical protein
VAGDEDEDEEKDEDEGRASAQKGFASLARSQ